MITIIIPCYNEEKRLAKSLPKIIKFLNLNLFKFEIIVVDDGSNDSTREVAKQYGCIVTPERENKGKGASIKEGVALAKGDLILTTDCDLSTPIKYLNEFIHHIPEYDIIIASRAMKESDVKTSFFKKMMGRMSNVLISLLVKDIKDSQCGFKLYKAKVAKVLFNKSIIDRYGHDFEILYLAQKYDYSIKEYPVKWTNDSESKVKLSDYPKTLMELFKIWRHEYEML